jgi:hypothetical protein
MRKLEPRDRFVVALLIAAPLFAAAPAPADLRLQWGGKEKSSEVRGRAGTTVEVPYEISNVGGSPAFAVVVTARTTVGPVGAPARIQPGPPSGGTVSRRASFALVRGMRELCIDAVLQQRAGTEPPDPDLANNRICRPIAVAPQSDRPEEDSQ